MGGVGVRIGVGWVCPRVAAVPSDGRSRPSPCRGRCHVARGPGDGPAGAGPSSPTGGSRYVLERKLRKGRTEVTFLLPADTPPGPGTG
ncbi:hypothetical protein DRB96_06035 [Streptomyces sp. ICC1]|nr:hypothetical protein DRB89_14710 [Streptomyces sp. ICC4]AWZ11945.1 hypothetical protein DRB96_06035 [Streptomyces sp. ICC1]